MYNKLYLFILLTITMIRPFKKHHWETNETIHTKNNKRNKDYCEALLKEMSSTEKFDFSKIDNDNLHDILNYNPTDKSEEEKVNTIKAQILNRLIKKFKFSTIDIWNILDSVPTFSWEKAELAIADDEKNLDWVREDENWKLYITINGERCYQYEKGISWLAYKMNPEYSIDTLDPLTIWIFNKWQMIKGVEIWINWKPIQQPDKQLKQKENSDEQDPEQRFLKSINISRILVEDDSLLKPLDMKLIPSDDKNNIDWVRKDENWKPYITINGKRCYQYEEGISWLTYKRNVNFPTYIPDIPLTIWFCENWKFTTSIPIWRDWKPYI